MEDKQFLEPEEQNSSFNPLDEPINEKSYTRPNVSFNPNEIGADIPEPMFTPPPLEPKKEEKREKKVIEPFNEELNDLPNKEKNVSSEHLADMILDGYNLICNLAENAVKVSPSKLQKLELEGEIDLSLTINFGGVTVTLREFVETFNEQSKGAFSVSEEFRSQARPILIKILKKKGIGLTDEQMLIMLFSKDIVTKTFIFIDLKKSLDMAIEQMKNQTLAYKTYAGGVPPQPQYQQQQYQEQPQPQYQQPQYQEPYQETKKEQEDVIIVEQEEDWDDEFQDLDNGNDMPDWAKPAPTANDIVNEMTNPEGLGTTKPKRTKRIK